MKKFVVGVISLVFIALLVTGCKTKKVEEVTDSEKVSLEYTVSKDNPFVYTNYQELINLEEGIVFFGYPENDFSKEIVLILIKEVKDKVLYFNTNSINALTIKQQDKLKEKFNITSFEVPAVYFIKDSKVFSFEDSLTLRKKEDYLTSKDFKTLENKYKKLIEDFQK